jgi:hypothetical protein
MGLASIKMIVDIIEGISRAFGIVEDKRLARKNAERDEKIRQLEREVAELKRANPDKESS